MQEISVLFWNIWLDNQIKGVHKSTKIINELHSIVNKYQPNFVGLNEVLQYIDESDPFIFKELSKLGYKNYYEPASPLNNDWLIGCSASTNLKVINKDNIILGDDLPAKKRGFAGNKLKAISLNLAIDKNSTLEIIVAHPIFLSLKPFTIISHYTQSKTLRNYAMSKTNQTNIIIGGDFNEPKIIPHTFSKKTKKHLYCKTGTYFKPTWQYNAKNKTPIRFNLDKIFWNKNSKLKLKEFLIIDSNVSDHKPLYAKFIIK